MSDTSIHGRIAADLQRQVARGDLQIGDSIPSESQLREQWGVSRGPVRQALATLRAAGVIGGGPGKPAVVRSQLAIQSFDTFVSFSRWVAGFGGTAGQRTIEIAKRRADDAVADALELGPDATVVEVLRVRQLDGDPVMLERTSFIEEIGRLLFDFDCDSGSIYSYLSQQGVDLSHARHVIDAVAADETDAELLCTSVGAPLLRERRMATSADGVLVEFSDDRYLPGRVSFCVDNWPESPSPLRRLPGPSEMNGSP